ncbi:protein PHYTOCHROME KINASE SUBSTRATE 1-like [Dendrobium catenatum]|uniref:protein PHYTOCHROME KINASE SUBSTRATE 1-like n=1 Tax=Dendrobium catenatum TaxID=906689 RepID=UPI0009F523FC|nr:protein PHYTOCHROME KINASE SUBSTRATE 1-like [Dendrobium catenatum]
MPSATLASPYNIPQELPFTYENSLCNNPRDDSFASYLAVVRDNLTPDFPITPTRLRPTPLHINLTRKRSDEDTEIDIFDAEKYFNGSPNTDPATPVEKTTNLPSPSVTLTKSHSLTWTVAGSSSGCSSQTTVNSRNVLLRDRRRRAVFGCGGGRVFHLGGLGFWCSSCSRKHAVNVNKVNESGSMSSGDNFVEQKQTISRSPVSWRIETSSPATWPTSQRRRQPTLPPPPQKFLDKDEDDRSDSSSDLFEIESVAMSRTGYEPSEASIAWSVVTASAANVSVASDRSVEIGKGRRKSAGLSLAGCASHKAVEVSNTAAAEVESSISPVVARYHVDLEAGGGSGRIVTGRASGTSWHGGSGRIVP